MSFHSTLQIKALSHAIADIHIAGDEAASGPRAIGEILRPFMAELRRARITGEPMREDILARFAGPVEGAARG